MYLLNTSSCIIIYPYSKINYFIHADDHHKLLHKNVFLLQILLLKKIINISPKCVNSSWKKQAMYMFILHSAQTKLHIP